MNRSTPLFLLFSLFSQVALSEEIILISYEKRRLVTAQKVEQIMTQVYEIPQSFIRVQLTIAQCTQNKEKRALLHLCINDANKIELIEINEYFLQKTIPLFLKREEV